MPEILARPCVDLIRATGYRGIAEVELIVRDHQAYVTECNPRTSGVTSILSFGNRVSSPQRLVYEHVAGTFCPPGRPEPVAEIAVPSEARFRSQPLRSDAYLHPTADSGHEPRAFLWGDPASLIADVSALSARLGRTLASRLQAAEGLC